LFDKLKYAQRNIIERLLGWLKKIAGSIPGTTGQPKAYQRCFRPLAQQGVCDG
jgi:hypothetical protein